MSATAEPDHFHSLFPPSPAKFLVPFPFCHHLPSSPYTVNSISNTSPSRFKPGFPYRDFNTTSVTADILPAISSSSFRQRPGCRETTWAGDGADFPMSPGRRLSFFPSPVYGSGLLILLLPLLQAARPARSRLRLFPQSTTSAICVVSMKPRDVQHHRSCLHIS